MESATSSGPCETREFPLTLAPVALPRDYAQQGRDFLLAFSMLQEASLPTAGRRPTSSRAVPFLLAVSVCFCFFQPRSQRADSTLFFLCVISFEGDPPPR